MGNIPDLGELADRNGVKGSDDWAAEHLEQEGVTGSILQSAIIYAYIDDQGQVSTKLSMTGFPHGVVGLFDIGRALVTSMATGLGR